MDYLSFRLPFDVFSGSLKTIFSYNSPPFSFKKTTMNLFYEDSGSLKVAAIVQKTDTTYQADTQHGKRVKIKAASAFIEFDSNMDEFLTNAQTEAADIDTELLWESVGTEEFSAEHAATEYFGDKPSKIQLAATYIALYAAPMYFHKKNKGIFKAAPEDVLKQALAAIERKAQQEAQIQAWADNMVSGSLPSKIATDLAQILHAPDKQSLTYKAYTKAADALKLTPYELAKHIGAIKALPDYLIQRFEYKNFPKGTGFPNIAAPKQPENLSLAENVRAFSIDDLETTEVDDALSVQDLGNGAKRIGIHIAAPSLAIEADSDMEKNIFQRQSTVYYPANKITMLPENWISTFSLDQGAARPAFSVYFNVSAEGELSAPESRIELVPIETNLRIQNIEPFFNSETGIGSADAPQFPHHADLIYLLNLSHELQKRRDRYEADAPKKYDYGIDFDADGKVKITRRERGSPIDTLVSEMMILANTTWAQMLDEHDISGLFRVQPSGRVRMSTKSEPHIGMNVAHYGWFTSPLRRACDYVNQKQLQTLLENREPRFAANDSALFAELASFESAYAAYREFQDTMESYWSLVWLQQENVHEINAMLLKDDLVRIDGLPLVARCTGIPMEIAPKSMLKLAVSEVDSEKQFVALKYVNVIA